MHRKLWQGAHALAMQAPPPSPLCLLGCWFRSAAFWQDVRLVRSSATAGNIYGAAPFTVAAHHMRDNVAGLSVEYVKQYNNDAGGHG
jgi:hypothetical protein